MENDRGVKKRVGLMAGVAAVIVLVSIAVHRFACDANPPFESPPTSVSPKPPGERGGGAGSAPATAPGAR